MLDSLRTNLSPSRLTPTRFVKKQLWKLSQSHAPYSMSNSQQPPIGSQSEREIDARLDAAISKSSSMVDEALAQLAKPCIAPEVETANLQQPPVGSQTEREIDARLDAAIHQSSSMVDEALAQLAKPCIAPETETEEVEDDMMTPINIAITRSSNLIDEARIQFSSPRLAPEELTEIESTEKKIADAYVQTYLNIEQMNDLRADTSQELFNSILEVIEEADENSEVRASPAFGTDKLIQQSSADAVRAEKRAKRHSRAIPGQRVAAVVASIEAIDAEAASAQALKHARNSSVRSFGQ